MACACLSILQGVGGHAKHGVDTTASSNSILLFDTAGPGCGGTHMAASTRSAKCSVTGGSSWTFQVAAARACLLIFQGAGGHANDGGNTTASSNSISANFFDFNHCILSPQDVHFRFWVGISTIMPLSAR